MDIPMLLLSAQVYVQAMRVSYLLWAEGEGQVLLVEGAGLVQWKLEQLAVVA